jgi:tetratricopeptide (TPR) repeat protein
MSRNKRRNKNEQDEQSSTMGTNIFSTLDNQSLHKSLNGQFFLYQVLLHRILDDEQESSESNDDGLTNYFEPTDPNDQRLMEEFDREYKPEKAIYWYTRESCIYKILNKSLRTQNIDDVMAFSKFVRDLNNQLQEEYKSFVKKQKTSIITLYRGQFISIDDVNRLKISKGQLLSMNSFLSTSSNKEKALEFAKSRIPPNDELTSVLFEISVNIQSPSRPFAAIKHLSAFSEEDEILFMFGSVFRIDDASYDEEVKLWRAKLTLCGENDSDLKEFSSTLTGELNGKNKQVSLGNYLFQMQKYKEAEEHYLKLLNKNLLNDPIELAYCYHGLAQVNQIKIEYKLAIINLNKALNYLLKNSPEYDHVLISQCYNDLGSVYSQDKNYVLAIQFYDKALRTKNNDHATTYSGLSQIHFKLESYYLAIEYLEKALEKQPKAAPLLIANTYIEIGKIYAIINQMEKASEMFDKAIESQLKILNPEHPDLAYTYIAQGMMYSDVNNEKKAFQFVEKAHQLQSESLPNNHPDFAHTYKNFGDLYIKKGDLDQALSYYQKSLVNQVKTLLWSHPAVAETSRLIGNIYWKKKDYEQALVHFRKVLNSGIERLGFGNPAISVTYKILADIYFEKGDLDQALDNYHNVIENELKTKLYEDVSLIDVYQRIADIYYKKRLLNQSLLYYHRLLDCHFRKKPFNESILVDIYTMIGKVYLKKPRFSDTLLYYVKLRDQSDGEKSTLEQYKTIEDIHFEKRHLDQALNYFENHLNQQIKNLLSNDSLLNETYQILGNIYIEKQRYDKSLSCYQKLLDNELKRKYFEDPSLINIYKMMGNICYEKSDYDQSLLFYFRLLDCLIRRRPIDDPSTMNTYTMIGKIYLKKHSFYQTSSYINKLIESQINNNQSDKSDFQFEKRHLDQSLDYFHKLLENKSKSLTIDSIYIIIGYIQLDIEDYHQALVYFHKLVNYQLEKHPLGDLLTANTYSIIGDIHFKLENFNEALKYYKNSLKIYQRTNPINESLIRKMKYKIRDALHPST